MEEAMDLSAAITSGAVLALFTAIQTWINKGRFDSIERRLEWVENDVAALRSDLLHVALDRRRDA